MPCEVEATRYIWRLAREQEDKSAASDWDLFVSKVVQSCMDIKGLIALFGLLGTLIYWLWEFLKVVMPPLQGTEFRAAAAELSCAKVAASSGIHPAPPAILYLFAVLGEWRSRCEILADRVKTSLDGFRRGREVG